MSVFIPVAVLGGAVVTIMVGKKTVKKIQRKRERKRINREKDRRLRNMDKNADRVLTSVPNVERFYVGQQARACITPL